MELPTGPGIIGAISLVILLATGKNVFLKKLPAFEKKPFNLDQKELEETGI